MSKSTRSPFTAILAFTALVAFADAPRDGVRNSRFEKPVLAKDTLVRYAAADESNSATQPESAPATTRDIGSRLELFVDGYIVDRLEGDAKFHLHKPKGKEVVFTTDKPWEDSSVAYFATLLDDGLYRMYYRGFHHGGGEDARGEPMCYAESKDGIHWTKPNLGFFAYEGSAENNIVLGGDGKKFPATPEWRGDLGFETGLGWRGDMVPFKDTNPEADADARYKALIRGCRGPHQIEQGRSDYGMYPFKSPDGIHWSLMSDKPVITKGRFDSQNLAFWDAANGRYVAFVRDMRWGTREEPLWNAMPQEQYDRWLENVDPVRREAERIQPTGYGGVRDIRMSTSDDFVHWSEPVFLEYDQDSGDIDRDLYTNAIIPYERAPHILLGFPTEIVAMFSSEAAATNPLFMASHDGGRSFRLWPDPLIPHEAPDERDGNRSNYMAHGLVKGNDREYYVYATEGYPDGERRLRRFTYRVDGFVSVRAGIDGGAVVTPPLTFEGNQLLVNYIAWPFQQGNLRIEIQSADGVPLEGLTLADCEVLKGDAVDHPVTWNSGVNPGRYAGQPVRVRFVLRHADLFSFQFRE